jgi:hypothetical protein
VESKGGEMRLEVGMSGATSRVMSLVTRRRLLGESC